jgi:hypothetical protein
MVLSTLGIEDFHRVLKSGCGIEQVAHNTAERIRRAIVINLVIAWRIMLMTLLGQEIPDLPVRVFQHRSPGSSRVHKKTPEIALDFALCRLTRRTHRRLLGSQEGSRTRSPIDVTGLSATPTRV